MWNYVTIETLVLKSVTNRIYKMNNYIVKSLMDDPYRGN
jgi:hypothetical protein